MKHISNTSFFIEIINGKEKGAKFQVVSKKISIGRSQDNDIVLNDPKISRNHATVHITPEGMQIIRLNPDRKIFIGKQDVTNAILELPSIIQIGRTKLKATMVSNMPANISTLNPPSNLQTSLSSIQPNNSLNNNRLMNFQLERNHPNSSKKIYFYIIIGIIGSVLYFVLSSPDPKEEDKGLLITSEEQEQHIDSIQEKSNELYRITQKKGKNTDQYKEARALFIQGLRDYREQNYLRAMGYFNGALAIFPQHLLSQRYLQRSQTKQEQLIQMKLLEANRYYEYKQYKQAMASYGQILLLVQDRTNKIYREAKGRSEECEAIIKSHL